MNAEHRQNLLKLAEYLEGETLKTRFDMSLFSDNGKELSPECGTVGCAIGHGPHAGIQKCIGEDWIRYAARVFGAYFSMSEDDGTYHFLFDCTWANDINNDPKRTASRIRYFLANGIPENWRGDYTWTPVDEIPSPQTERVVYVTVDAKVRELQKVLRDN